MILQSENIIKAYKDNTVLNGIDFNVNEGEVHAILGKTGLEKAHL